MEFRLLGSLEVVDDGGPVPIVAGHESALLALLLIHAGRRLPPTGSSMSFGETDAPVNATKSVQVYVSRLRKALGAERIETTAAGYRIRIEPGELDTQLFEEHARGGRLEEALALWRGAAAGGVSVRTVRTDRGATPRRGPRWRPRRPDR